MSRTVLDPLLGQRRPVLLDGAVGTELARRGVDTTLPLWSARALFDDPGLEALTKIHEDYARAGAEILVTNTFRTTRRSLGRAGKAGAWREANRRAVECARAGAKAAFDDGAAAIGDLRPEARTAARHAPAGGRVCLVAGGIAPLEDCYRPDLVPQQDECLSEHRQQVEEPKIAAGTRCGSEDRSLSPCSSFVQRSASGRTRPQAVGRLSL